MKNKQMNVYKYHTIITNIARYKWPHRRLSDKEEHGFKIKRLKDGLNVDNDGTKIYSYDRKLHRADGPAIVYKNGSTFWYFNGKKHRADGPAEEYSDGSSRWWFNNKELCYPSRFKNMEAFFQYLNDHEEYSLPWIRDFAVLIEFIKHPSVEQIKEHNVVHNVVHNKSQHGYIYNTIFGFGTEDIVNVGGKPAHGLCANNDGDKFWYLNGEKHRVDGPAIEMADGTKEWWLNGERHRVDGPAIDLADGTKEWWLNGERHRVDGPAIVLADGTKEWYLKDSRLLHKNITRDMEEWVQYLNDDEDYSLQWIDYIDGLIGFIENPTGKQTRLNAMRWKI